MTCARLASDGLRGHAHPVLEACVAEPSCPRQRLAGRGPERSGGHSGSWRFSVLLCSIRSESVAVARRSCWWDGQDRQREGEVRRTQSWLAGLGTRSALSRGAGLAGTFIYGTDRLQRHRLQPISTSDARHVSGHACTTAMKPAHFDGVSQPSGCVAGRKADTHTHIDTHTARGVEVASSR